MIRKALWTVASTVAVGILLSGLCGCDAETASGTTTTPAPPRGGPVTATEPVTAPDHGPPPPVPDGHVRVTGMVFSAIGDGLVPDRPFEKGKVAAVPLARFMAIQEALKPDLVLGEYVQDSLALPRRLLAEDGVGTGELGEDGTYSLALRPGRYALCLVELGGKRPQGTAADKFWIERWLKVTVTSIELQTILPVYNRQSGKIRVLY
ncbi:MAG: hypothetical protein ACYTF2_01825 [Planctomycetota bacterium]|jgi:hypothetical protein